VVLGVERLRITALDDTKVIVYRRVNNEIVVFILDFLCELKLTRRICSKPKLKSGSLQQNKLNLLPTTQKQIKIEKKENEMSDTELKPIENNGDSKFRYHLTKSNQSRCRRRIDP
jgi:hypothetical protein